MSVRSLWNPRTTPPPLLTRCRTEKLAWGVHRLQLMILLRGLELLVPGGILVYSTCSMNPIEDEAVVAAALSRWNSHSTAKEATFAPGCHRKPRVELLPTDDQLPGLKRLPGISTWAVFSRGEFFNTLDEMSAEARQGRVCETMFPPPTDAAAEMHLERCMRVLPHMQDTGGFFIAVLRKEELLEGENEEDESTGEGVGAAIAQDAVVENGEDDIGEDIRAKDESTCGSGDGGGASASLAASKIEAKVDMLAEKKKLSQGLCFAFQKGNCTRGADCRYAHLKSEEYADADGAARIPTPSRDGKVGEHVKGALHCSPRNRGKYDSIFTLKEEFVSEIKSALDLKDDFPGDQLVVRSATDALALPSWHVGNGWIHGKAFGGYLQESRV